MTRDTPIRTTARAALLAALCVAALCSLATVPVAATGGTAASDGGIAIGGDVASAGDVASTGDVASAETAGVNATGATAETARTVDPGSGTDTESTENATIRIHGEERTGGWSEATYEDPAGDVVTLTLDLSERVDEDGPGDDSDSGDGADADDAGAGDDVPDHAYVQIGSAEAGFIDVLYLVDADDDGEVTVSVNTRTLGTSDSVSATNADLVYPSPGDEVRSAVHGRLPSGENGPTFVGADGEPLPGFDAYLAELGLIGSADTDRGIDQLARPIQPGTYPVAAGTSGEFRVLEAGSTSPGEAEPGTSAMAATEGDAGGTDEAAEAIAEAAPLGRATIDLSRPGIEDVSIRAAPAGPADAAENRTALQESMGPRESVAAGDRLVIEAEATGIYGHLVAIEGDFASLEEGFSPNTLAELETRTGEGVRFAVEAESGPVLQGPGPSGSVDSPFEVLDLSEVDPETVAVYADEEAGELYVVVDTREVDAFDPGTGDGGRDFSASMDYESDPEEPFLFDREDRHIQTFYRGLLGGAGGDPGQPAFPYLDPGENATGETNFSVEPPRASFEAIGDEAGGGDGTGGGDAGEDGQGTLRLRSDRPVRIAGETNLAPGTEATLRVASGETASLSYVQLATVEVGTDGSFAGTFNLTEASPGDTAEVSFETETEGAIATANATIVGPGAPTTAGTPRSDLPTFTEDPPSDLVEETPGFGVGVAIVGLVVSIAAAVGIRRHREG
jgi:hypothetical protein